MDGTCYTCDQESQLPALPAREAIAYDRHWRVAHATGCGLLGWLVLVPRRHVLEVAELTDDEAAGLGTWQVRIARRLTEEQGVSKVYVTEFGEVPGFHLHFHIVPRADDLDDELRGPGIFGFLNRRGDEVVSDEIMDDFARALSARLSA